MFDTDQTFGAAYPVLCSISSGGDEPYRPTRRVSDVALHRAIEQRIESEMFADESIFADTMNEMLLEPLPEDWRKHYWHSRTFAEALRRAAYLQSTAGVIHLTSLMDTMIQQHIAAKVTDETRKELEQ